ncbi:MAG: sterol desaturase family protein [Bdellovibrionales bacterium]|nr:sterol desaturase family protein [Bdellovibrionales bacterium]
MELALLERVFCLAMCGGLLAIVSRLKSLLALPLGLILVISTSFLMYLSGKFHIFAFWHFTLFWIVVILEWLFPRDKSYKFLSKENLKSACFIPFHALACLLVVFYFYELIQRWPNFRLNWVRETLPFWYQVVFFIFTADLIIYCIHRAQHTYSWYWSFHRVHHASTQLTSFANFRTNIVALALVPVASRILLFNIFRASTDVILLANAISFSITGVLSHSNLDFPGYRLRWLNYLIVTPNYHSLHHSIEEKFVNFAETFPLWDILFGTFEMPKAKAVIYGIQDQEFSQQNGFMQTIDPFLTVTKFLFGTVSSKPGRNQS